MSTHVAVDLGASSGRVMLARVGAGGTVLDEVHRFGNEPVTLWEDGRPSLHWDVVRLFAEVLTGLRAVRERLGDGERVTIAATAVLPGVEDLLTELARGSRVRKIPRDVLREVPRRRNALVEGGVL